MSGWQIFAETQQASDLLPGIKVAPGWVFDPRVSFPPEFGWPASLEENLPKLKNFPKGILALVVEPRLVGVYWDENTSANAADVAVVGQILEAIEGQLLALDERIRVSEDDENS